MPEVGYADRMLIGISFGLSAINCRMVIRPDIVDLCDFDLVCFHALCSGAVEV